MKKLLVPMVILAGCNAPTFKNLSAPSKTIVAQGMTFKVIYTSDQAEAYRITNLMPPEFGRIQPAAVEAMEKASGCRVNQSSFQGDPAKLVADLVC